MSETSLKLYTWVCGYGLVSEHPENPLVKESASQTPPFKVE